jgi:predicted outer membrane repeat protein
MSTQAYRGWLWAFVFALLMLASVVQAKTLTVEGSGRADFRSIAAAVEAAASGDVIVIEPGTYSGGIDIAGKVLTLRSRDPNNPNIVGSTGIDCGRGQAFRIGDKGGTRVTLAGLTIHNGHGKSEGGAVLMEEADLDVINCVFRDNTSGRAGGAIYSRDGRARFVRCTFSGNTTGVEGGGAVFARGGILTFLNCSFEANTGSALRNTNGDVTLTECTFRKNSGEDGGAIQSRSDDEVATGVAPRLNLVRCTFIENAAVSSGGAIFNHWTTATLHACTFKSNTAGQDGGAIYSRSNSSLTLGNCAFIGNMAVDLGGAIANWYSSSTRITNSTFVANSAAVGGAVVGKGASYARINHCILWKNVAAQGRSLALLSNPWDYAGPARAAVEFSDLEGGRGGAYVEPDGVLSWGSGNIDADPQFIGVSDYGLSGRSPCIDTGDPLYVPDPKLKDLAGNPRLSGVTVDMGAYEAGPVAVYRFWSPLTERHFYTMSRGERDKLIRDYAYAWTYEGIAFYAYSCPLTDSMVPVHRLWSSRQSSHFWTTDEKEMQRLLRESPDLWVYEGIAFYVHPPFKQPWGTVPVHRFWWTTRGGHFYTANEDEKDKLLKSWDGTWVYEGIVWYVFGGPSQ